MKLATEVGKKMVDIIFKKQRILVEMGTKLINVQHGLV